MPVALLERRKAQEFARALERAATTGPSGEPLVRVAHTLIGAADGGPVPSAEFRARLRDRLLTEATHGDAAAQDAADATLARGRHAGHGARSRWRRRVLASGAGLVLVTGAAAGVAVASGNALPGDPLYPVKRLVERAELALPASPADRGQLYLDQASIRMREVQQTIAKAGPRPMDARTARQVGQTLDSMRTSVQHGGSLITSGFSPVDGDSGLRRLSGFINAQRAPIAALENQLPEPLAARAPSLLNLLNQLGQQVTQLSRGTVAVPYVSAPAPSGAAGGHGGAGHAAAWAGQARQGDSHAAAAAAPAAIAPTKDTPSQPASGRAGGVSITPPTTSAASRPTGGSASSPGPVGLHITIGKTLPKGSGIQLPPVLPGLPTIGIGIGSG